MRSNHGCALGRQEDPHNLAALEICASSQVYTRLMMESFNGKWSSVEKSLFGGAGLKGLPRVVETQPGSGG